MHLYPAPSGAQSAFDLQYKTTPDATVAKPASVIYFIFLINYNKYRTMNYYNANQI